jgi:hypothetical protein
MTARTEHPCEVVLNDNCVDFEVLPPVRRKDSFQTSGSDRSCRGADPSNPVDISMLLNRPMNRDPDPSHGLRKEFCRIWRESQNAQKGKNSDDWFEFETAFC